MMIPKRKRVKDLKAIKRARKEWCELCGNPYELREVHHIRTKGSGGGDVSENLVCLCCVCHRKVHTGQIDKETLLKIKSEDTGLSVQEIKSLLWGGGT